MTKDKNRWCTTSQLSDWFNKQMTKLEEDTEIGESIDALINDFDDRYLFTICLEGLKAIEIWESVTEMADLGQRAQKEDLYFYNFEFNSVHFIFLAKNIIELKKSLMKIFNSVRSAHESEPPAPPTRDERIKSLLSEIRSSHISDPKNQSKQEKAWCAEIDKLMRLI